MRIRVRNLIVLRARDMVNFNENLKFQPKQTLIITEKKKISFFGGKERYLLANGPRISLVFDNIVLSIVQAHRSLAITGSRCGHGRHVKNFFA